MGEERERERGREGERERKTVLLEIHAQVIVKGKILDSPVATASRAIS